MQHKKHHKKETVSINPWHLVSGLLLILLIASILTSGFKGSSKYSLSDQEASDLVVSYINTNVPQISASSSGVEKESGLYKITLNVNGQQGESYLSSDGKLLFPQVLKIEEPIEIPQPTAQPSTVVDVSEDNDPFKGNENAPVTIIEFADFQCPFCKRFFDDALSQLEKEYINTGKVKLVYRDFPLTSIHPVAQKASEASECANEQGKFWEYHDSIYNNQDSLSLENLKQWAVDLKLDTNKFNDCLDSGKYEDEVNNDLQDGVNAGVTGTPSFFINGKQLSGAQPFSAFKSVIDQELN